MGLILSGDESRRSNGSGGLVRAAAVNRAFLSGWELLGSTTLKAGAREIMQLVAPMIVLVLVFALVRFSPATEILLGVAVMLLSGLCLLAIMGRGRLVLESAEPHVRALDSGHGSGLQLFIQLALRRHGGEPCHGPRARRTRTAAVRRHGHGRVRFAGISSNPGMASLGKVCAIGIGANMLFSVFLLPAWWTKLNSKFEIRNSKSNPRPSTPSAFYRAGLWRAGLVIVRIMPPALMKGFCVIVAELYWLLRHRRCEVVVRNFLPVFGATGRRPEKRSTGFTGNSP